jgi:hypothetical protein
LVWNGNAASVVDLHSFLPAGYNYSAAISIDQTGDIFGEAQNAQGLYAVEWVPTVPEPASASLFGLASLGLLARPRRRTTPPANRHFL